MNKRLLSAMLSVAVLVTGGFAAYAVLADATFGGSAPDTTAGGADATVPPSTPTVGIPVDNTRANVDAILARDAAVLKAAVAAVEAVDVDGLLSAMTWKTFPCTAASARGGIAPKCAEIGLPDGSAVPMFHYNLLADSYFTQEAMKQRLQALLVGRQPVLALVARRPDGTGLISFTLNDNAKTGLRGLDFTVDFKSSTPLLGFTERYVGSTPLDTIREDEYMRKLPAAQALYISPALQAWEREKDELQRDPRPGPGVTPAR